MAGDLVVLAEEPIARDALAVSAGLKTARQGGIVIGRDFRTSVPGIWAIGDAAVFDGVRLGLLVAAVLRRVGLRLPAAPGRPGRAPRGRRLNVPAAALREALRRAVPVVARWTPEKPRRDHHEQRSRRDLPERPPPNPPRNIASYIDHTLLKPEASEAEILKVCAEAAEYRFKSVCVNPVWVKTVKKALKGSGVLTCSVVGFPLGATPERRQGLRGPRRGAGRCRGSRHGDQHRRGPGQRQGRPGR